MKIIWMVVLLSLAAVAPVRAELSKIQQDFLKDCQSRQPTNWFYDCACAADKAGEVVYDLKKESKERVILSKTNVCEKWKADPTGEKMKSSPGLANRPTKEKVVAHWIEKSQQKCTELEKDQMTSIEDWQEPGMSNIWLRFAGLNVCKDRDSIYEHELQTCSLPYNPPLSEEDAKSYCECVANHLADAWLETSATMNSRTSVALKTKAMMACQNR